MIIFSVAVMDGHAKAPSTPSEGTSYPRSERVLAHAADRPSVGPEYPPGDHGAASPAVRPSRRERSCRVEGTPSLPQPIGDAWLMQRP